MEDLPIACSLDGRALAARQSDLRVSVLAEAATAAAESAPADQAPAEANGEAPADDLVNALITLK